MFEVDQLRLKIETIVRELPELQEDEQLRGDMLDGLTEMPEVLEALFHATDNNKTMVEAIGVRIDQLSARRSRLKARIEVLRDLMLGVLQSADLKKVELPEATLSQRKSQPQIVGEPDVSLLPEYLTRTTVEPDRAKIRETLLRGDAVPGLSLSNAPPSLAITVR